MQKIAGSIIKAEGATDNMQIISDAKQKAKEHKWLYHCTSMTALVNMIKCHEMWLSNLKVVNDKEEAGRINLSEFEKSYYIGCFTYDPNISVEHWKEYGRSDDGVLIGMKQNWFKKKIYFLDENKTRLDGEDLQIYDNLIKVAEYRLRKKNESKRVYYYIVDYGFYQVIYNDELEKKLGTNCTWCIDGSELQGRAITFGIAGIIKKKNGICYREGSEPYCKNWEEEKEVRLKVGINSKPSNNLPDPFYERIAIEMKEEAFREFPIKFCPNMTREQKEHNMEQLKVLLPDSDITEI